MPLKKLRRLLIPVDQEAVFHSSDPADPRVGDVLAPLDSIEGGVTTRCVIVGCPQHIGIERNSGRPGAAAAPDAIRSALHRMATSAIEVPIRDGRLSVSDAGDIDTNGKTLEQIHDELHDVVENLIATGHFPIVLGGGHDCAWPTICAYEEIGEPYGLINIDAHADVRPLKDEIKAHSGSPFRQMLDASSSFLAKGAFVEFGLQHVAVAKDHLDYLRSHDATILMLDEIRSDGVHSAWSRAIAASAAPGRFHITLDMDGFASAFAPGVSAPSTNGFTPWDIAPLLRMAASSPSLTSFDVVEVSPPFDQDGRTAKLAASMIMEVLAGLAERR